MRLQFLYVIFFLSVVLLSGSDIVLAQAINHKVTPRVIDLEVTGRDIFEETITIENFAPYKVSIYPSVNEVSVDSGGDVVEFSPQSVSDNTTTVTSWLAISRAALEILPGESTTIPLSIRVNPNAEPGEYHAFIGFGTGRNRDIAEKQVADGRAPGVIVTLRIGQNEKEFLKLGKFIIDRFVTQSDNAALTYTLTNPSTVSVIPRGEVIFSDSRGNEVGSLVVNPNNDQLVAGQSTDFKASVPTDGLLGKYKAFLSVDYGSTQISSVQDTAFYYAVPLKILIMIFLSVLFFAVIITIYLHRRFNGNDLDDHEGDSIPMYIVEGKSIEQDHDINLK